MEDRSIPVINQPWRNSRLADQLRVRGQHQGQISPGGQSVSTTQIRRQKCNFQQTRHSTNAVAMLAHRLRRCPYVKTALGECSAECVRSCSSKVKSSSSGQSAVNVRRWPNIETALGECPVFAGKCSKRGRCRLV